MAKHPVEQSPIVDYETFDFSKISSYLSKYGIVDEKEGTCLGIN